MAAAVQADEPMASDRRIVTVLFADLCGFTALSERLDPEDVRVFQNRLFSTLTAAIDRYGGFVEKYVGDAVMAVFGAPIAHEDDPERALRAALAMRDAVPGLLDAGLPGLAGTGLQLHIGVHTGPVVAGTLGSDKRAAYAVTGDTVNTAARLQTAAEPGEILVSAATHALVQHAFAFVPRHEVRARGKSEAMHVYRLQGTLSEIRIARGLHRHGLAAPLLGRGLELGALHAALARATRGLTQIVSVLGDAGQGKTRLISEFLAQLPMQPPIAVRRVACSSLGERSYGTVAGLMREAYGIAADEPRDSALQKLTTHVHAVASDPEQAALLEPMLAHVLGLSDSRGDVLEPEVLGRQIVGALRMLIEQRMQQGPLVLVLEDLQWVDSASLELLHHLVERLPEAPFMIVLAYRSSFTLPYALAARPGHSAIKLPPLASAEVEGMLCAFFGASVQHWPTGLRELMLQRAGGNPLYLEEIVRHMMGSGLIALTADGWQCQASETVEIPVTIQALLIARLDQLPASARRVLLEAAVIGPRFDDGLLRRITTAPDSLAPILDALLESGLLEPASLPDEPLRRFRFAHALLHEAAYANLLLSRRTELHGAIAQSLESTLDTASTRLEDLASLARHFSLSALPEKAAAYLLQAGDWARKVYANEDAVLHYQRALAALRACKACETAMLPLRERLGDVLGLMGRRTDATEHFTAAERAWAELGRADERARLLRKLGSLHWEGGGRESALRLFQLGLDLLEGGQDGIERSHLYRELGRCAFRSGDHQAAAQWAQRALGEAQQICAQEPEYAALAISNAHNTLGIALARLQRMDEAVAHLERSVAVAQSHDLLQAAARAYSNLAVVYAALDAQRGIEACQRGLELARRIGDFSLQSRLYANLAVAYCALSDRCEEPAREAAQASTRLDRTLEQRDHLAIPLIVLGQIHQCHGQPQLALEHYREALAVAEESGEPQLLFPCYDGLATVHLDLGDEATAEQFLARGAALCEHHGLEPTSLVLLPFLT